MGKLLEQRNRALDDINAGRTVKKIRDLESRVRELEEENARLKEIEQTNDTLLDQLGDKNAALLDKVASQKHCYAEAVAHYEKQLAAEQLNNKLLRESLIATRDDLELRMRLTEDDSLNISNSVLDQMLDAIDIPTSTEALDAYVAEKVKEAMK